MGMDNEAEDRKRKNHKRTAENRFVFHAGHNINFSSSFALIRTLEKSFLKMRRTAIRITMTVMTTTGARFIRKSLKSRCVAEPIMTFGGFPIISAVPPMLHINISEIRIGTGDIRSMRHREIVMGAIRSAAVTESMAPPHRRDDRKQNQQLLRRSL